MNIKKFVNIFVSVIFIFVIYNFVIWNFFTKNILYNEQNMISGDLARTSYLSSYSHLRETKVNLEKQHISKEEYKNEKIDIITIGDSFSNGNVGGKNPYYQDYLATKKNLNVLNLQILNNTRNYIETVFVLLNSGFLEKADVKYILIECVQRTLSESFVITPDENKTSTIEELSKLYNFSTVDKKSIGNSTLPPKEFINNGNFKFLLYNLLYNFSDNAFISRVNKQKLNKELFSIKDGKDLLFYETDLKSINKNSIENLTAVNNNLNKLAKKLKEKKIQLIFMPAVNKYDLYSSFIVNNKYPLDPFFDSMRTLEKSYIFIDTKDILLKQLNKGEKDIYYIDDTHWSYKGSDTVTDEIISKLNI